MALEKMAASSGSLAKQRLDALLSLNGPPLVYSVRRSLLSLRLIGRFCQLHAGDDTLSFLEAGNGRLSLLRDGAAKVLRLFLSVTDANALTGRGGMFVFSREQLLLLGMRLDGGGTLLDVGAGDGGVTSVLAPGFNRVVTTEISAPMASRLRGRGWECVEAVELAPERLGGPFDVVSCLNVLDRADRPLTLLRQLKRLVSPGHGRLLLAVVLPWCPFVEEGSKQRRPAEMLPMRGGTCAEGAPFETSLRCLVERVLEPEGFVLERWSRVPYLSRGDWVQPYYTLSDALIVLRVNHSKMSQ